MFKGMAIFIFLLSLGSIDAMTAESILTVKTELKKKDSQKFIKLQSVKLVINHARGFVPLKNDACDLHVGKKGNIASVVVKPENFSCTKFMNTVTVTKKVLLSVLYRVSELSVWRGPYVYSSYENLENQPQVNLPMSFNLVKDSTRKIKDSDTGDVYRFKISPSL